MAELESVPFCKRSQGVQFKITSRRNLASFFSPDLGALATLATRSHARRSGGDPSASVHKGGGSDQNRTNTRPPERSGHGRVRPHPGSGFNRGHRHSSNHG